MDYLLLTLILLLSTLSGTVIWWMLRNETRIRLLQIDLAADRAEMRSGLSRMETSIGLMNLSSEALLQSNPIVSAVNLHPTSLTLRCCLNGEGNPPKIT